jgi:hypothetical protein
MSKITDLQGRLEERRSHLHAIFEQAGPDNDMSKVTLIDGDTAAKVEHIQQANAEMGDLAKELKELNGLAAIRQGTDDLAVVDPRGRALAAAAGDPLGPKVLEQPKSMGQLFVESEAYKGRPAGMGHGPQSVLDVGMDGLRAATFQRSAGWAPESLRTGRVVEFALRPIQVTDLFSTADTTSAAVVYMEETTATNAAAERAENAAYVESTLVLTQRTVTVETVGTSLPITDEQLADVAQAQSYVDGRLGFFVMQRLDSQLLNGDGITPNIRGLLNATGLQTQAKGADPVPDAIYKAMQKVRVAGRAFPSALCIHPDDWTDVRLLRTADGVYIWGNPSMPGPETIWGLVIAQTDAIAANTGLVGDFSPVMVQLYIRQGLEVQVGYVNDDFLKGKQTVRAGIRCANVIYRGAAFCTVTGI